MFYDGGMVSGALVREARRRAGLSQAQLGERVGRPQTQIARWEREAVLPSLETVRELVRACDLELTVGLAERDDSYAFDAAERLALPPRARFARAVASAIAVRALAGSPRFDPLPALDALEEAGVQFILIGSLAGALRGSPVVPLDATIAIVAAGNEANLDRLEHAAIELGRVRSRADDRWHLSKLGAELAVVERPAGTFGWHDLRRDSSPLEIAANLRPLVASLADLVRIAEASPEPEQHGHVVALRTTLELARTRKAEQRR